MDVSFMRMLKMASVMADIIRLQNIKCPFVSIFAISLSLSFSLTHSLSLIFSLSIILFLSQIHFLSLSLSLSCPFFLSHLSLWFYFQFSSPFSYNFRFIFFEPFRLSSSSLFNFLLSRHTAFWLFVSMSSLISVCFCITHCPCVIHFRSLTCCWAPFCFYYFHCFFHFSAHVYVLYFNFFTFFVVVVGHQRVFFSCFPPVN